MAKKQLKDYKFVPAVVPPAYNQFPNAVTLLQANKTYIVSEIMGFMEAVTGTPAYHVSPGDTAANARVLLLANKEFIKEEANAFVLDQISSSTAPFVGYFYDSTKQAKCKRDIGYLIDAFLTDLEGGGNFETIRIARMFYLNGTAQLLNPVQEAAVHTFVKDLIATYVLTKTPFANLQNFAAQVTSGNDAEADAIDKLNTLNDIVIDVITLGVGSLPAISYNFNATWARRMYGATKCKRDIAYILDAVAYDIALQTNYNALFIGHAESNSLDFDQTVIDAINVSKTSVLALSAVSSSAEAIAQVNGDYTEILTIADGGSASAVTFTDPSTATTSEIAAKDKLIANKTFIQAEINAWVGAVYPAHNHSEEKCARDIGYLVDALCYDILYGGNSATFDNAKFFYYTGAANITDEHKAQTVAAYGRFAGIVADIVEGVAITKTTSGTTPNTLTQDTSGNAADAAESTILEGLIQIVADVIDTGVSTLTSITRTAPDVTWSTTALKNAKSAIETASVTIQNTAVTYSDYTYDQAKCIRDSEYIVDAYIHDMTFGGNSLTYYVASQYQINGIVQVNQPQVEVDVQTWARDMINDYILTNTYHASYQWTDYQTVDLGLSVESSADDKITELSNIVINCIDQGLDALPAPVAPDNRNGTLFSGAVALLEANKKFIQEEAIAYIQYNIDNNIIPFVYFTYNSEKCRRDVSYVLEGYISDLKNGGNRQTVFNASKYFENGVPQVDGDRLPEVYTHVFIRDLIDNFIWENIAFTPRQILASQTINNAAVIEPFVKTRLKELSNTIINVITNGLSYMPTVVSNRGYIKVPGFFKLKDFLLITNSSRNTILYNFADPLASAEVTYDEKVDSDFPGALYGVDKITTITFSVNTSGMMVTDNIQIFVEGKEQEVKLNRSATDAMERMKVGIPQSMLDADFEYGLQPTKWQALAMMRNYPAIYEIPGSDTPVINVTTDASVGTNNVGASLITVTTVSAHGFLAGEAFTIKALANTISGFSRAEGSFIINSVPSNTTFTYYAKSKVGTSNGQQLASTYTQLRKGNYYTGAAVGTPAFNVYSAGAAGNVTTSLITAAGSNIIGFTGDPPQIGSPLSGTGIATGTQVTAAAGSGGVAASTTLATKALIGDTSVTVSSTTGLSQGLIFDRGDGYGITVTGITGNDVSFSGALTADILGNAESYTNKSQDIPGSTTTGSGAVFTVSRSGATYTTTTTTPGAGYIAGDTLLILGSGLGGSDTTNDATITVDTASPIDTVTGLDAGTLVGGELYSDSTNVSTVVTPTGGTGLTVDIVTSTGTVTSVAINQSGTGYSIGDVIKISPFGKVKTTSTLIAGSGYSTANNVATSGGTGTGLTVNVTAEAIGGVSTATITTPGSGYSDGIVSTTYGGAGSGLGFTITTTTGTVTGISVSQVGGGYAINDVVTLVGGNNDATVTITGVTNGEVTAIVVNSVGTGYTVSDSITIAAGGGNSTFTVSDVSIPATIEVDSISAGGLITSVSTTGTPITAPTNDFISAFTISEPTTAEIADGNTGIAYSSIATIQVTFGSAHGFLPGNSITTVITSAGTGAQLAAGPYYVEQVPDPLTIRYTARAPGNIDNTLVGVIYGRPDSFFVHRPFDGGVQLGTAGPAHGATAIRMSKKYIRYQSGKGVMYNTGALFAPSYDLRSLTSTGTAVGSVITVTLDDTDHGCQIGGNITIQGVSSFGYDGDYTVTEILDERRFKVVAQKTLETTTAQIGSPCYMSIRKWHGATVRAGIFDDQNGMFWQYDGIRMAVVRRSSTFQLAGTIDIDANSNLVTGTNTRFTGQLAAGDRIVIKGMTHIISQVTSDTSMTVTPDFRGVSNVRGAKCVKTIDLMVPQEQWNLDSLNGAGASGYNIDVTKMQMIGLQHTWYGAGFIDFMLRGPEGNYTWAHRFRNSNVNTEAYMRTGNQPVRYEVINEGAKGRLTSAMTINQTTIPMSVEDAYWFPSSGVVIVDNELIRFTGNNGTALTGCVRSSPLTQFVAGSQRNFTAGPAATHAKDSGVVLISNTITPNISHWGSAFMMDGQFDSDRGYIFNYASTGVSVGLEKATAFLIRLAPSVSNAQIGDLGEKELLNRAQLLLSSIAITSDSVSGGGGIVIEGVLNPINYPTDPTKITWTGLASSAAGGQPSFAQIAAGGSVTWSGNITTSTATVQGAFTTTLTAKSFNLITANITATAFNAFTQNLTVRSFAPSNNATYTTALSSTRTDFLLLQSDVDAANTSISVGDTLTVLGDTQTLSNINAQSSSVNFVSKTGSGPFIVTFSMPTPITWAPTTGSQVQVIGSFANGYNGAYTVQAGSTTSQVVLSYPSDPGTYTGGATISFGTFSCNAPANLIYPGEAIVVTGNQNTSTGRISGYTSGTTYYIVNTNGSTQFQISTTPFGNPVLITTAGAMSSTSWSVRTLLRTGQTVAAYKANDISIGGQSYARVTMNTTANYTSGTATTDGQYDVPVRFTSSLAARYSTAISNARSDFLIPQTQYASTTINSADVLSVSTYLTGGQTVSSTTASYCKINGTTYAQIVMTANGTATSPSGAANSVTVTVTNSVSNTYNRAISSSRLDFLITDAQYDTSGIQVSDPLSVATFITGGQTISSITRSYLNISGTNYTRIIMNAVGSSNSTANAGNDVTVTVTAAGTAANYVRTNYLYFTASSWASSGATVGTKVDSTYTSFPAGTSVTAVSIRTLGGVDVYRVVFTQSANTTIAAAATPQFKFGAQYALPGEQVFSFIANPGESANLSLESLKELTSTAIGGRGTFPNGPDVLAINIYKVSGTAVNANVILRWGEAQA